MYIENARGFKGDKEVARVEVATENGNTIEKTYNKDGICLSVKVLKWNKDTYMSHKGDK